MYNLLFALLLQSGSLDTSIENDLARFACPLECLGKCSRCPVQGWSEVAESYTKDCRYCFGRNAWILQKRQEQAKDCERSWHYLRQAAANQNRDRVLSGWHLNELRETIGDAAFSMGLMPPFPGVVEVE